MIRNVSKDVGRVIEARHPMRASGAGEVAVSIDEARDDRGTPSIDHARVGAWVGGVVVRADPDNNPVLHGDCHSDLDVGRGPISERSVSIDGEHEPQARNRARSDVGWSASLGPMRYFAYGSNLCAARLAARAPSAVYVGIGNLPGHELRFHKRGRDGSAKADAMAVDGPSVVWGAVAELDPGDVQRLDAFEPGYERVELHIQGLDVTAWVYRAGTDVIATGLAPQDWYLDLVVRGARARGLPDHYIAWLSAHRSVATEERRVDRC